MLIEVHMLQNHAPANLNRDETGSPKDAMFGGFPRARISSQCIKRSIRFSPVFQDEMKNVDLGIRTRLLPELVKKELKIRGVSDDLAEIAAKKVSGFGTKEGTEQKENKTAQILFLSPEDVKDVIDAIYAVIKKKEKDPKAPSLEDIKFKDLSIKVKARRLSDITPDLSLFGRMTTSDALIDVDAAVQVAHAISTNKIEREFDFFVAIDDISAKSKEFEDKGAAMMGTIEFNSSCFYKYFSLDVEAFIRNIYGKDIDEATLPEAKKLAIKTIHAFLKAAIFTSPSGKQNTFAAHQLPDAILVEIRGQKTPLSYANAFLDPCRPIQGKDLMLVSIEKMKKHAQMIAEKFNIKTLNKIWFTTSSNAEAQTWDKTASVKDLDTLFAEIDKSITKEIKKESI
jgi:CRISPR system Cascade subunit CasC